MPTKPSQRNYKKEYARDHSSSAAKKARASRNKARKAKKGCRGEVDHKDGNPRNNAKSNLRCISRKKNRALGAKKVPKASKAKGGRRSKPS